MELLFKREQTEGNIGRVKFKLWGKLELDENEQSVVDKYRFDQAALIEVDQPELIRQANFLGVLTAFAIIILATVAAFTSGGPRSELANIFVAAVIVGIGVRYLYVNAKRETLYVKDLLHGRYFSCDSVVDLARKEAWIKANVAYLRQVMESAKYWDGTERVPIEALPKDEAHQMILQGA